MSGKWLPEGLFGLTPWPASIVDDVTTAQFDHRFVAYIVVLFALAQAFAAWRRASGSPLARRAVALAALALLQAALGVATLLFVAPIGLALVHQAMALLLLGAAVAHGRATGLERVGR
jgi:cytochrome c oxidase assembly protein subunit 15